MDSRYRLPGSGVQNPTFQFTGLRRANGNLKQGCNQKQMPALIIFRFFLYVFFSWLNKVFVLELLDNQCAKIGYGLNERKFSASTMPLQVPLQHPYNISAV